MAPPRRTFLKSIAAAAAMPTAAFAAPPAIPPKSAPAGDSLNPPGVRVAGIRMLPVVGGKYKVWTKQVGSGGVKLLLLHGGPGANHVYLEAMESFFPEAGVEFYFYDQLGGGYSDLPADPSLWTLARFTQEVEEVRQGLGLDDFVIYGHSWGGVLAIEYALHYQQHLRGLVVSNMAASIPSLLRHLNYLKTTLLPPAELAQLNDLESNQRQDSPAYQSIVEGDLYSQVFCRLKPWPEPLTRSFNALSQPVYNQIQGKSEFEVTGNLKNWDRWNRLHEIRVKTLTIGAKWDEMDPADMKKMSELVQHGSYAYCPNGSHLCMWDDQEIYFEQLLKFLRTV